MAIKVGLIIRADLNERSLLSRGLFRSVGGILWGDENLTAVRAVAARSCQKTTRETIIISFFFFERSALALFNPKNGIVQLKIRLKTRHCVLIALARPVCLMHTKLANSSFQFRFSRPNFSHFSFLPFLTRAKAANKRFFFSNFFHNFQLEFAICNRVETSIIRNIWIFEDKLLDILQWALQNMFLTVDS